MNLGLAQVGRNEVEKMKIIAVIARTAAFIVVGPSAIPLLVAEGHNGIDG